MKSQIVFFLCLLTGQEIGQASTQESTLTGRGLSFVNQLTKDERNALVTLVFRKQNVLKSNGTFISALRIAIATALNDQQPEEESAGHQKESNGRSYHEEDVSIPGLYPKTEEQDLQIPLIAYGMNGVLASANDVREAVRRAHNYITEKVGVPLVDVFKGASKARSRFARKANENADSDTETGQKEESATTMGKDSAAADERPETIWEAHRWLFISIIIFIGISILLTIICCICLGCRRKARGHSKQGDIKEEPTSVICPPGLMQEQTVPNEPPPLDEENGWIIPLDQMTKEELEQPEVQVSRL